MSPSNLPLTGRCYNPKCRKPCKHRFCNTVCQQAYHYRQERPEVQRVRGVRHTAHKITAAQIEANIARIVEQDRLNPKITDNDVITHVRRGKSWTCRRVG